jgi:hypothetical protein
MRIVVRIFSTFLVGMISFSAMAEGMFVYFGSHGSGPIGFRWRALLPTRES